MEHHQVLVTTSTRSYGDSQMTVWFSLVSAFRVALAKMASARRPLQLVLFRHLGPCRRTPIRCIASSSASHNKTPSPPQRKKSWLTRQVETSPTAKTIFMALAKTLGYGSPKQVAGRRAFVLYESVCAVRPDDENVFWQRGVCVFAKL